MSDYDWAENFDTPDDMTGVFHAIDEMARITINARRPDINDQEFCDLFIVPGGIITVMKKGDMDYVKQFFKETLNIETFEPGDWNNIPQEGLVYHYWDSNLEEQG